MSADWKGQKLTTD